MKDPGATPTDTETDRPVSPPHWRILVVDDNRDAASMMSMLLDITGHETRVAHDGPQALVEAQAWLPDAVLLDIGLPLLSGHEVARRLRKEPWGRGMVLLALTGWGQDMDRQASQQAGFDAHLVKPIDHEAMLRLLGRLLAPGAPRGAGLQA